jgi:hypothetical protein
VGTEKPPCLAGSPARLLLHLSVCPTYMHCCCVLAGPGAAGKRKLLTDSANVGIVDQGNLGLTGQLGACEWRTHPVECVCQLQTGPIKCAAACHVSGCCFCAQQLGTCLYGCLDRAKGCPLCTSPLLTPVRSAVLSPPHHFLQSTLPAPTRATLCCSDRPPVHVSVVSSVERTAPSCPPATATMGLSVCC